MAAVLSLRAHRRGLLAVAVMAFLRGLKVYNILGGGNKHAASRAPRFNQSRVLWGPNAPDWKEWGTHDGWTVPVLSVMRRRGCNNTF